MRDITRVFVIITHSPREVINGYWTQLRIQQSTVNGYRSDNAVIPGDGFSHRLTDIDNNYGFSSKWINGYRADITDIPGDGFPPLDQEDHLILIRESVKCN